MYSILFDQNDSAEAVFVWDGVHVGGHVSANGESWMLEGCGDECFLWIKQTNDWLDETSAPTSKRKNGIFQSPDTDKLLVNYFIFLIIRSS